MLPPHRRPERERQRHRPDERERVPVVERLAQPRDPLAVRHEVRDHLAQESPQQHGPEQPSSPSNHARTDRVEAAPTSTPSSANAK